MNAALAIGASNALLATGLALVAWAIATRLRNPRVALVLWLLVLVKLLSPPLVAVPFVMLPARDWSRPLEQWLDPRQVARAPQPPADESLSGETFAWPLVASDLGEFVPLSVTNQAVEFELPFATPPEISNFDDQASLSLDAANPVSELVKPPATALLLRELIAAVWLGGSLVWLAVAAGRIARFRRLLSRAHAAPANIVATVEQLAGQLSLRRIPDVRLVEGRVPPLVWALFGRPTILVPRGLLAALSVAERETLLAHELTHLARRDHWLHWLELPALALYWWHPVAWWARGQIERAAETCCDARVVALLPHARQTYAAAMLETVEFLAGQQRMLPWGAYGFSQLRPLKRRMEMVLNPMTSHGVNWPARGMLFCLALIVLPLSLTALRADAPPSEPPPEAPAAAETPAQEAESIARVYESWFQGGHSSLSGFRFGGENADVEVAQAADSAPQAPADSVSPTSADAAQAPTNVEQRLDRLEKMLQMLTERLDVGTRTKPTTGQQAGPATRPAPAYAPKIERVPDLAQPVDTALGYSAILGVPVRTPPSSDPEVRRIQEHFAEAMRQAQYNLGAANLSWNRRIAAEHQWEVVKAAYAAGTVNVAQLLEAQRRNAEAKTAYLRAALDLARSGDFLGTRAVHSIADSDEIGALLNLTSEITSAARELACAKANLSIANDALVEAKSIWADVHAAYSEGGKNEAQQPLSQKDETMAREQYFQFKANAQNLHNEMVRAESRVAYLRDRGGAATNVNPPR